MTSERLLITIDTEVEPNEDQSAYEIAAAVILEALHSCGIFPTRFTIGTVKDPA